MWTISAIVFWTIAVCFTGFFVYIRKDKVRTAFSNEGKYSTLLSVIFIPLISAVFLFGKWTISVAGNIDSRNEELDKLIKLERENKDSEYKEKAPPEKEEQDNLNK